MSEDDESIKDRVQSKGEKAAADLAQALISSPGFGQAVSAAAAAREKAGEAQRAAMGALNVSSQDEADRLERRLRVLSERLEESEDRLDRALAQVRGLNAEIEQLRASGSAEPGSATDSPSDSKSPSGSTDASDSGT
jgi:predicted  nucleic acid-binding Zn-ribbon protein